MALARDGALQGVKPDRIILDVTRTISRAGLGAATGIDRVEAAWIDWAQTDAWREAWFVARLSGGVFAVDAKGLAAALIAATDDAARLDLRARTALRKRASVRRAESAFRAAAGAPDWSGALYANVGHANLTPESVAEARARGAAGVLVKLHDVIPLDHPEFARPDGPEKMRLRLAAAAGADLNVFNSEDTRRRAHAHMPAAPPACVAPLGIDVAPVEAPRHGGFVALGTIEPRKNHALLLDVWETLAAEGDPPTLHIIGRRGWLNEDLFARLDARPGGVVEHSDATDAEVSAFLSGARALLFPSFAEGYGLPLAEALALGVPVIASDLPALREVGGAAPDYLSPDDVAGWRKAIEAHAGSDAPAAAQARRRSTWRAPTWAAHFAAVDEILTSLE